MTHARALERVTERGDEHRLCGDEKRAANGAFVGVDGVRQPGIAGPRPPQRGEDEQSTRQRPLRRMRHELRRHLCESEGEDEVEEQLERRHSLLVVDGDFAHGLT